jgi:hypothetical protein
MTMLSKARQFGPAQASGGKQNRADVERDEAVSGSVCLAAATCLKITKMPYQLGTALLLIRTIVVPTTPTTHSKTPLIDCGCCLVHLELLINTLKVGKRRKV